MVLRDPDETLGTRPLDPQEAIEVIKEVISGKRLDPGIARRAIDVVLRAYEQQLLVFMVGMAKTKVERTFNAMAALKKIEGRLFDDERIEKASTDQLIKMYSIANAVASESLDYIQKVVKLRPELEAMGAAADLDGALARATEAAAFEGLPPLAPAQRDMARRILQGVIDVEVSTATKAKEASEE